MSATSSRKDEWKKCISKSKDSIVYNYHENSNIKLWLDPHSLSASYIDQLISEGKKRKIITSSSSSHNGVYLVDDQTRRKRVKSTVIIEDHPLLAIERERLLNQALDLLAAENTKYGEMTDDSKTSREVRKSGMRKGLQGLFARIVWYELLNQIHTLGDIGEGQTRDSILPIVFAGDKAVMDELVSAGRTREAAIDIVVTKVGGYLVQCANYLIQLRNQIQSNGVHGAGDIYTHTTGIYANIFNPNMKNTIMNIARKPVSILLEVDRDGQVFYLTYETVRLDIAKEHFDKLLRLYRLHTNSAVTANDPEYLKRVFNVIQRYETLSGKSDGYQMAFPTIGFQFLRNKWEVKTECFASPLNCFNQRFCSVAKDTDHYFGSLGNFFLFEGMTGKVSEEDNGLSLGGSFEANPPFVEAIMDEMADRIFQLLEKYPTAPFSFIVIVPKWTDCRGVIEMTHSRFTRPRPGYRLELAQGKHDYRPGMQHRTSHTHQKSKVDTLVFFLQNEPGAKKWPVSEAQALQLQRVLEDDCGHE